MGDTSLRLELVDNNGESFEVLDGDIVGRGGLGRSIFASRKYVSRLHAQFVFKDGSWTVTDLNSVNGTFLDGKRITPFDIVPIEDGQSIGFSKRFSLAVRSSGAERAGEGGEARYIDERLTDNRVSLAIMFVDLRGSTAYFQKKGTIIGRNWIYRFYEMLKAEVASHNGTHIKNIGDSSLVVFPNGVQACNAALHLQRSIREQNRKAKPDDRYYLKVGINAGRVLFEDEDVFGNAVNIAARIQSITPPGDIYFSATLYNYIKSTRAFDIEYVCMKQLKGVKDRKKIYKLNIN